MNFVEKLIEDTYNGDWDFFWKYSDGSKTYTINKAKHYLSGLNFSFENDKKLIIFPNGYGLTTELLEELRDSVDNSLERTVDKSIEMYLGEKELPVDPDDVLPEPEPTSQVNIDGKSLKPKRKPGLFNL
jgi:hypothetical protein